MGKKFVGNAAYSNSNVVRACLFSSANSFATASTLFVLARQCAEELGDDWKEKTTFKKPTAVTMFDHGKPFHLQELGIVQQESFLNAIEEALRNLHL